MHSHQVKWQDGEPESVNTLAELNVLLDRIHSQYITDHPVWVIISGSDGEFMIVLGHTKSAVSFIYPDGMPPYLMSVNGSDEKEEICCFFAGHHSPILSNNLIPLDTARHAVCTFIEHHALSLDIRWSDI
jgi:hypothetical protein